MGKDSRMAQLPTQSQFGDYSEWPGRDVLDSGGQRLGGVREIYLDRETGRPEWVLVDIDGGDARFVPLADANVEGWSIKVAHSAETIKKAPGIGAEPRIDQSEERRLYAHYGLGYSEGDSGSGLPDADAPPPAPTGSGKKEEPEWQARGGEPTSSDTASSPPTADEPAPFGDTTDTTPEPTNLAPPPAEPPSPAELEEAHIPEDPPAASDRGSVYETAPFGAVPPPAAEPETPAAEEDAPPVDAVDSSPPVEPADTTPGSDELTPRDEEPPTGAVDAPPLFDEPATPLSATDETADTTIIGGDTSPLSSSADDDGPPVGELDSPPADTPPVFTSLTDSDTSSTIPPPDAADTPEADAPPKPSWAASGPVDEEQGAPGGALERVKRDPKKVALAAAAAAVLFFIIRRLR